MNRVITFYSYKGGTGRSMALANVAWILASAGNRVLTIDWDLEAPGLHRYFRPFLTDTELSGQESQGVIDMAIDFAVRAATPLADGETRTEKWYEPHADFSKWRQKLRWPSGEPIKLGKKGKGEIDFVSAGRQGNDYAQRVSRFDWHTFYERLGGGAFFDAAKRKLAAYDYVLIDSRTGVSDTSGICTVHMPDALVVCFTLNYQSIDGAFAVAKSVKDQRPDIQIWPVPTRIDGSEARLLNRMKGYAAEIFSPLIESEIDSKEYWYSMEVPYFARYAYAEKLALFEEQASISTSTLPAMERLTNYLTEGLVRSVGRLPAEDRTSTLAEFEGLSEVETDRDRHRKASLDAIEKKATTYVFLVHELEDKHIAEYIRTGIVSLFHFDDSPLTISGSDFGFQERRKYVDDALSQSDLLVVIKTSTIPKGLSYTGYEIGFFLAAMRSQNNEKATASKQIIFLNIGDRFRQRDELEFGNVDVIISGRDLLSGRDEYLRKAKSSPDGLEKFFDMIIELPYRDFNIKDSGSERRTSDTYWFIRERLLPDLRARLFDSVRTQAMQSVEQHHVVLKIPKLDTERFVIPGETILTANAETFSLFGLNPGNEGLTWDQLRDFTTSSADQPSIMISIERAVLSTFSPAYGLGEDHLVRLFSGGMFRVVVTKHLLYFDGRRDVFLYLLPVSYRPLSGQNSIIANFVYITTKLVELLEASSPLSVESFAFEHKFTRVQGMVRRLVGEIIALEEQAGAFGLDEMPPLRRVFGSSQQGLETWQALLGRWATARNHLLSSAERVMSAGPDSTESAEAKESWLIALNDFRYEYNAIRSVVAAHALDILKEELSPAIVQSTREE